MERKATSEAGEAPACFFMLRAASAIIAVQCLDSFGMIEADERMELVYFGGSEGWKLELSAQHQACRP